jgi:serine phosphatase RsbU (regulator of sigma subunit)
LVELIVRNSDLDADKLCENIEENLIEFTSTQHRSDDLTIVAIKIGERNRKLKGNDTRN